MCVSSQTCNEKSTCAGGNEGFGLCILGECVTKKSRFLKKFKDFRVCVFESNVLRKGNIFFCELKVLEFESWVKRNTKS